MLSIGLTNTADRSHWDERTGGCARSANGAPYLSRPVHGYETSTCAYAATPSPAARALIVSLNTYFPNWRRLSVHESSPSGPASDKLEREAGVYSASQYLLPNVPPRYPGG